VKKTDKNFDSFVRNLERALRSLPERGWKNIAALAGFPHAQRSDLHAVAVATAQAVENYEVNNAKA
jgi:hypothetical protein